MASTDDAKAFFQAKMPRQKRLLKARKIPSPVLQRNLRHAFARHCTLQQASTHVRTDDHTDAVPFGKRQDSFSISARHQRIGRRKGGDGRDYQCSFHLRDAEIGHPNVPNLALFL
jgi:hypothetical protein